MIRDWDHVCMSVCLCVCVFVCLCAEDGNIFIFAMVCESAGGNGCFTMQVYCVSAMKISGGQQVLCFPNFF